MAAVVVAVQVSKDNKVKILLVDLAVLVELQILQVHQ
jgi:hypothetical protein